MKKLALLLISVMLSISIVACSDDDGPAVYFYIVRHAETESNAKHGLFGWYDSPLTPAGIARTEAQKTDPWEAGGLGGIVWDAVYSSTSGRAINTARILAGLEPLTANNGVVTDISTSTVQGRSDSIITDPRLREINFGRFEGLVMTVLDSSSPFYPRMGSAIGAQSSLYFALIMVGIVEDPSAIEKDYTVFDFANDINEFDTSTIGNVNVPYLDETLLPNVFWATPPVLRPVSRHATLVAETGAMLRTRIDQGMRAIAQREAANGGGNVLVVAHGITIMVMANIFDSSVDPQLFDVAGIGNNSVLRVRYQNGNFTILSNTWRDVR